MRVGPSRSGARERLSILAAAVPAPPVLNRSARCTIGGRLALERRTVSGIESSSVPNASPDPAPGGTPRRFHAVADVVSTAAPKPTPRDKAGDVTADDAIQWRGQGSAHASGAYNHVGELPDESSALRDLRDAYDRLLLAVESGDIGTFDFAAGTRTLHCSERCRAIYGLPPNAPVTVDDVLERVHADDRARVQALAMRALDPAGAGDFEIEYRIVWRDRTSRSVIAKGRTFFEGTGSDRRAVQFVGTVIDVTERRRAESYARLLAEASSLLASSLDTEVMLAGVARLAVQSFATFVFFDMVDDNGTIMRSVALHRDGAKSSHMHRARELAPDPAHAAHDDPTATALREQRVVMSQLTGEPTTGPAIDDVHRDLMRALDVVSQIAVPLVARGRALGIVTFLRSSAYEPFGNIEREIAEELARRTATAMDNAQLYRTAVAANDAKSTFLASMSHELRTPLTAIIGYEELLADGITGPVTDSQRQQLGRIKASATHLLGLIDEILTYSRVEAGSEHAHMDVVDVCTMLEEAASLVEPLVGDRGLALAVVLPDDAPCIRTDAQKLRQILVNLLSNATKFTERGGITLSAQRVKREVHFRVRDTGIGIPAQHLQQIFEPFWQVDQRANRRVGGTGLGLTVSRRLAQLIGGDLSVESHVGGGSTFVLQLPALD